MLATLDNSAPVTSRWSIFSRSASPVHAPLAEAALPRSRSAGAVSAAVLVRKRSADEAAEQHASRKTRLHTTWLDRFYMAARLKMGLWQTEGHEAEPARASHTLQRRSSRGSQAASVEYAANQDAPAPAAKAVPSVTPLQAGLRSLAKSSYSDTSTATAGRRASRRSGVGLSDTESEASSHCSLSCVDEDFEVETRRSKRRRPNLIDAPRPSQRRCLRRGSSWCESGTHQPVLRMSTRARSASHAAASLGHHVTPAGDDNDVFVTSRSQGKLESISAEDGPCARVEAVPAAPLPSPTSVCDVILTPSFVDAVPYPPSLSPSILRNKKRRVAGEEDISDEFYMHMHRPLELIEKRSRKRELELLRYAEHLGKLREEAPELFAGHSKSN